MKIEPVSVSRMSVSVDDIVGLVGRSKEKTKRVPPNGHRRMAIAFNTVIVIAVAFKNSMKQLQLNI